MSETTENTFTSYLGHEFQQNLMWQILVEPEFGERVVKDLAVDYFDDPILKRMFIIINEYHNEYSKVPNLQNQTIQIALNLYKTPNNIIEHEQLFAIVEKIKLWNDRVLNQQIIYSGEAIQKLTINFIKQQEYRKLGEFILDKTKSGEIKNKNMISILDDKIIKISNIGDEEDYGIEIGYDIKRALSKEFRETIPTGIAVLDGVTGGGLGRGEIGLILTPSGVGKAQPLSSKILTPNGWVKMGNIKIDDLVIGSDGKSQKVLGVYPQGKRPIYKIDFNDGTSTYCDKEHLWSVNSRNNRSANTTINVNGKIKHIKVPNLSYSPLTTNEIIKNYKISSGLNYRIPIIKPVEFENRILPINPYLLGVLIGDGGLTQNGIRLTSIDNEIINNIKIIIKNDFSSLTLKQISNTISYGITGKAGIKNNLYSILKSLEINVLSSEKFIPEHYKYSSINDRILLLQGLLDTDGYASKTGCIQFTSSSKQLANDVRELVLSLGGFCSVKEKMPKYKYLGENKKCKLSHILTISFSNNEIKPFLLKRKQDRVVYRNKYSNNKYISLITYSHEEDAQCIYVENDDHLYVTDDYILTHNTTTLTKIANTAYDDGKKVLQIIFEDTEDQVRRKHFTIWSGIPLSKIDDNVDKVDEMVIDKIKEIEDRGGKLIIKKFSQENTTIKDIKNWIVKFQKLFGYKFDEIILDYLDCLESNVKGQDRQEAELAIVKSFLALSDDFNIPCWSALQSNRTGSDTDFLEVGQIGGNVKRYQKAHFFMSIAKHKDNRDNDLVNIKILKARFKRDGQEFKDSILNNDTMDIKFNDNNYHGDYHNASIKLASEQALAKLETSMNKIHVVASKLSDGETVGSYSEDIPIDNEPKSLMPRSYDEIMSVALEKNNNINNLLSNNFI